MVHFLTLFKLYLCNKLIRSDFRQKQHTDYNHLQKKDTWYAHIFLNMWISACMDKERERRYAILRKKNFQKHIILKIIAVSTFLTLLFMKINLLPLPEVFSKVKVIVFYAGQNWSNSKFTYFFIEPISIYTMATIHQAMWQSF